MSASSYPALATEKKRVLFETLPCDGKHEWKDAGAACGSRIYSSMVEKNVHDMFATATVSM